MISLVGCFGAVLVVVCCGAVLVVGCDMVLVIVVVCFCGVVLLVLLAVVVCTENGVDGAVVVDEVFYLSEIDFSFKNAKIV